MAEAAEAPRAKVLAMAAPRARTSTKAGLPAKAPQRPVVTAKVLAGVDGIPDRRGPGVDALRAMTSSTRAIPR
jgi:hypothetical protein